MLSRRNLPIFIALCGSLALHWLWFRGAQHYQVKLAAIAGAQDREPQETTIQLSLLDPPTPKPPEPKPQKPADKPEPNKPKETAKPIPPKKPQIKFPDEMGERSGKGIGSNKAEGLEPLKALEAEEDQAFLSRNPGARGQAANHPASWLMSPGEGGRGGHTGSPVPAGQATSASDDVPAPADSLAMQSPHPQESDSVASASPPAPPDVPAPRAQPQKPQDSSAVAPPAHSPPAAELPEQANARPRPADPAPAAALKLSPVSLGPKVSTTPPESGDEPTQGTGQAGVEGDPYPTASDPSSGLHRTTTQPSRQAGHVDGAQVALQLPVPFIAPTRTADNHEPPAKPSKPVYALLAMPPAPAVSPVMPEPPKPAVQQPRQQPENPNPSPTPRNSPPTPSTGSGQAPPTPSAPAPAAGASASAQATGDGRQPGSARPSGDPGHMSDSESDPFSKIGSAQILHDGKLDVRFGRKIKTVRPHLPVVGQVDSFALANPSVTLRVSIDTTGKVTEVAIHKSSGSNEIDQPCLIAMYDWWFEPLQDAKGNALPDCVLFTISFR
jgi:TonB family protein